MTTLRKFVERLERQANDGHGWDKAPQMMRDAAATIKRLTDAIIEAQEWNWFEPAEIPGEVHQQMLDAMAAPKPGAE